MSKQERKGQTKITSVSVSEEFMEILERYNLSPTEVFRRGVAVTLHDLGNFKYNTPMNKERSEFVKKYLKDLDLNVKKDKLLNSAVELIKALEEKKDD